MNLWSQWYGCVQNFQAACSRSRTFWCGLVHRMFPVFRVGAYDVYVADGLKVAKEGKKMPGVKKLHQASENNSKAPYIMGHSIQALALLVGAVGG